MEICIERHARTLRTRTEEERRLRADVLPALGHVRLGSRPSTWWRIRAGSSSPVGASSSAMPSGAARSGGRSAPPAVRLRRHRPDEADDRGLPGEDADHLRSPLHLFVQALQGVGAAQPGPVPGARCRAGAAWPGARCRAGKATRARASCSLSSMRAASSGPRERRWSAIRRQTRRAPLRSGRRDLRVRRGEPRVRTPPARPRAAAAPGRLPRARSSMSLRSLETGPWPMPAAGPVARTGSSTRAPAGRAPDPSGAPPPTLGHGGRRLPAHPPGLEERREAAAIARGAGGRSAPARGGDPRIAGGAASGCAAAASRAGPGVERALAAAPVPGARPLRRALAGRRRAAPRPAPTRPGQALRVRPLDRGAIDPPPRQERPAKPAEAAQLCSTATPPPRAGSRSGRAGLPQRLDGWRSAIGRRVLRPGEARHPSTPDRPIRRPPQPCTPAGAEPPPPPRTLP